MDQSKSATIEGLDLLDKFNFLALPGTVEKNGKKTVHVIRNPVIKYIRIAKEHCVFEFWRQYVDSNAGEIRPTDDLLAAIEDKTFPSDFRSIINLSI